MKDDANTGIASGGYSLIRMGLIRPDEKQIAFPHADRLLGQDDIGNPIQNKLQQILLQRSSSNCPVLVRLLVVSVN